MLEHVTIYTKKLPEMVAFYRDHFGFDVIEREGDRITELIHPNGGMRILLHKAANSQKMGQALVKLGMDVRDIEGLRTRFIAAGIKVGPCHDGIGYLYCNLKDPSGNTVALSSRAYMAR
ncbi:MAG: VOC family protein [Pseudomonadota bacterium]